MEKSKRVWILTFLTVFTAFIIYSLKTNIETQDTVNTVKYKSTQNQTKPNRNQNDLEVNVKKIAVDESEQQNKGIQYSKIEPTSGIETEEAPMDDNSAIAFNQPINDELTPLPEMDTNQDGIITIEEYSGEPTLFDFYDDNDDGVIDEIDLQILDEKVQGAIARQQKIYADMVDKHDLDGDGHLTIGELEMPETDFNSIDSNGDTFISMDEVENNPIPLVKHIYAVPADSAKIANDGNTVVF